MSSTPLTPTRARDFTPGTPVRWWISEKESWRHGVVVPQSEIARFRNAVSVQTPDGRVFAVQMSQGLVVLGAAPARS